MARAVYPSSPEAEAGRALRVRTKPACEFQEALNTVSFKPVKATRRDAVSKQKSQNTQKENTNLLELGPALKTSEELEKKNLTILGLCPFRSECPDQ